MHSPLMQSAARAAHPVLLIAAVLASMLPAWLVSLPIGAILASQMDYSAEVQRLARHLRLDELVELLAQYQAQQARVQTNVGIAWICLLACAPALYALLFVVMRDSASTWAQRVVQIVHDYPRWFFLQLFAFLVWAGFALAVGYGALALADYADAVFELSRWQTIRAAGIGTVLISAVLIHFLQISARAEYLRDPALHFPPLAYWRAVRAGRFGWRMLSYLLLGLMAWLMLLVLSGLRLIETDQPQLMMLIALVHSIGVAGVLGWLSFARVVCLSHYAHTARPG